MPNVNFFELEACLSTLQAFCQKHPRKPYVARHATEVDAVAQRLQSAVGETDRVYTQWRLEHGEDKLAYKQLQKAYKGAQRQLKALGVMGYPEQVVSYWDEEDTLEAAQQMLSFLQEHKKALDFAADTITELKRLLDVVSREEGETRDALGSYRRISGDRKLAMEFAIEVIGAMRRAMRRDLGRHSELYLSVRWPAMVEPDPM